MMNSRPTKKPNERGSFSRLRRYISKLVSSRAFLFSISLFSALCIWSILVASDGTLTREKVFPSVAVSVTGESALRSRGYIVTDDLDQIAQSVRMTVEVTQANYNRVSGTSYNPHFDLSQVTGEGENTLNVSYSSQLYGPVTSCEPSTITVNVERYITRRVPVVLEMVGEMPQGLYLDSYKTDPTMLSISGPQSLVTSVSRVVARLDLGDLSHLRMSDRTAIDIVLEDANGQVIQSPKLEVTNQTVITGAVVVETELVPQKSVPLVPENFVTGSPAQGFVLSGVELGQESMQVAARQEALDAITLIGTDSPLNIEGATQDVTGYVRIRKPSGVENTLPTEIAVTARIEEATIERTFKNVAIEIDGLDEQLSASLSKARATVQLTGAYHFITDLTAEDIRLFVDLSDCSEGSYDLPVQIHIDNAQEFSCALSSPEITVSVKTK